MWGIGQPMQLEATTLRPLSHVARNEINGAADFDAGQNYTRPQRLANSPHPYPSMIGYVSGLLPLMSEFVVSHQQNKQPSAFYSGGSMINLQGGMSFGFGINGLKKITG